MSGISKVVYGNETLMDISQDTVNENNLLLGATAHGSDGEPIEGAVITHDVIDNLTSTSTEDALSANQGKVLNDKIGVLKSFFANEYSSIAQYRVGDLCIYDDTLWMCIVDCDDETPSPLSDYWVSITIQTLTPIRLVSILYAGQTSVTFNHHYFQSGSAVVDVYTDKPNLGYDSMSLNNTTLTITFPAQLTDTAVQVVITR